MKEFYFDGMPVGYFEQDDYPTTDGQYHYMPYRGPGHYKMQTSLARDDEVRCSYDASASTLLLSGAIALNTAYSF